MIRPPLAARVYAGLFGVVWCGLVGFAFISSLANGPSAFTLISILMLAFGGVVISSNLRARVIAEPDELRVRNFVREQRLHRSRIVRFVEHTPGGMPAVFGGMIAALLAEGRLIDLRATARGPFGRSRRIDDLRRLQSWLER